MHEYLQQILLEGVIHSTKDFRVFWLMNDRIEDMSEYDIDYTPNFIPSMSIDLPEGTATILLEKVNESELTFDSFCRYKCAPETPILFKDYAGITYDSYSALQRAYVDKQLQYYRTQLENSKMTIGELDDICLNRSQWDAGMNYTTFLDEGRILVEVFPVADGYIGIYADIEPLTAYEVTTDANEAEYFKDFPVRINFLYTEQIW